jgi:hypothetical protein
MKIWHQNPSLKAAFSAKVEQIKQQKHDEIQEVLSKVQFPSFINHNPDTVTLMFNYVQTVRQLNGNCGELMVGQKLKQYGDESWILFKNALIPTHKPGNLTEIDHLIISRCGVFLLELKSWKGSFSAYKDKWKRREGNSWIPLEKSPSSQSLYHKQMFERWIRRVVLDLPGGFVTAPVVFVVAQWVGTNQCSMPVLHGVEELLDLLSNSIERLTPEQVTDIATAVANYTMEEPEIAPPKPPTPKPIKKPQPPKVANAASPKSYTMQQSTSVAKIATAAVTQWLQGLPQTISVQNVEDDPRYRAIDVNLLLTTKKGKFKLEVKGDRYDTSGNFFFETYSNRERNTPGYFLYTKADWFCYYFVKTGVLYLLPMPATRDWFLTNRERFKEKPTTTPISSGGYYTRVGQVVPIDIVRQEVADVKRYQLQSHPDGGN